MSLKQRKLIAIVYLATLPRYKTIHENVRVRLLHWGNYGYDSQGSYNTWEEIERVEYYDN